MFRNVPGCSPCSMFHVPCSMFLVLSTPYVARAQAERRKVGCLGEYTFQGRAQAKERKFVHKTLLSNTDLLRLGRICIQG